jgi:hypothetical protein
MIAQAKMVVGLLTVVGSLLLTGGSTAPQSKITEHEMYIQHVSYIKDNEAYRAQLLDENAELWDLELFYSTHGTPEMIKALNDDMTGELIYVQIDDKGTATLEDDEIVDYVITDKHEVEEE